MPFIPHSPQSRWLPRSAAVVLGTGALLAAALLPSAATAKTAAVTAKAAITASIGCVNGASPPAGGVACHPEAGTPHFPQFTKKVFTIRQLVQCGGTMFAVGSFSQIIGFDAGSGKTVTFSRNGAFSFQATRPFAVTSWNPDVNGEVNSIALSPDCSTAYLGGKFTKVHGSGANNIAEVSATTGVMNPGFAHNADHTVETLLYYNGMVLTGGFFTAINGSDRKYYVALNATTGLTTGYINLHIHGHYVYARVAPNRTRVYNQQLSHAGHRVLVEGDFTSVGGQARQQIFMISLKPTFAKLTAWTSPGFYAFCWHIEPFYIKAASWSPDDTIVYIATTGLRPLGSTTHGKRTGLCDAAAAFPSTETSVGHIWRNYTGCDSLYATVAGQNVAYFAGHERWADNRRGCNNPGPGSIPARGMVGLKPSDGSVIYDPSRSRGHGADDMILTSAGLWIASDNFQGSDMCGHRHGFSGICFLP
jgi:hypothetical protein